MWRGNRKVQRCESLSVKFILLFDLYGIYYMIIIILHFLHKQYYILYNELIIDVNFIFDRDEKCI